MPTGWGGDELAGGHYGYGYRSGEEPAPVLARCISAGLNNGEQVLYSMAPEDESAVMALVEREVEGLASRVAAGQLRPIPVGPCVDAWKAAGVAALRGLAASLQQEALRDGHRGIRWVGHATAAMRAAAALGDFFSTEAALTEVLHQLTGPPPLTIFCLYEIADVSEPVRDAHIMLAE